MPESLKNSKRDADYDLSHLPNFAMADSLQFCSHFRLNYSIPAILFTFKQIDMTWYTSLLQIWEEHSHHCFNLQPAVLREPSTISGKPVRVHAISKITKIHNHGPANVAATVKLWDHRPKLLCLLLNLLFHLITLPLRALLQELDVTVKVKPLS